MHLFLLLGINRMLYVSILASEYFLTRFCTVFFADYVSRYDIFSTKKLFMYKL